MLFRLMLLILSKVLAIILSEFLDWVLSLLWIRLERKIILLNLRLGEMKNSNIWKIVIGAISAALGYILSAIGVWLILLFVFIFIAILGSWLYEIFSWFV